MIKKASELVNHAIKQISRYQKGEDRPVKTRNARFNKNALGGIFKNNVITLAGISGSGKTYLLQQMETDIFDKTLNPDCDDYVLLRVNWEMSVFKLLLRRLKSALKTSISDLLFNTPDESVKSKMSVECNAERNPNIFYLQDPCTPKEFFDEVYGFLNEHRKKKHIIISIDHLALTIAVNGNKKQAIDEIVENINVLNKEFSNVSFILVTQMNRSIEERSDVRFLSPRRGDIYASDTIFHMSDIVIAVHHPFKLGHTKYMAFETKDYEYLSEFMTKPGDRKSNFNTKGLIFHHYLKLREVDDDSAPPEDIHIERILKGDTPSSSTQYTEQDNELQEAGFTKITNLNVSEDFPDDDIPF